MQTQHQDLYFGETGQTVYLDVPEGRPSSVTGAKVLAWDASDDADSEWTVSASIDSLNTTFDANSGRSSTNNKLLNLADTSNVTIGRQVLGTDAKGIKEWIQITGVTSGESATALLGMGLDYVSGDALVGTRISATVDATWIADVGNQNTGLNTFDRWRIRWEYVVSSVTYVRTSTFSVSRRAGQHTVTPIDFSQRFPSLYNIVPSEYRQERLQLLIDRAYQEFSTDLIGINIPDEQLLSPKIVNEMTVLKTAVIVAQDKAMSQGDTIALEIADGAYSKRFQSLFAAPSMVKVPVSTDTSGAGDKAVTAGALSVR